MKTNHKSEPTVVRIRSRPIRMLLIFSVVVLACATSLQATTTSITTNFNNGALGAGNTLWFTLSLNPSNLCVNNSCATSPPVTLYLTGGTVTSSDPGLNNITLPNTVVTFDPTISSASTSYDAGTNTWTTLVPLTSSIPNVMLDAFAFTVPTGGLPGSITPTLSFDLTGNNAASGFNFQWQWAAAQYTNTSCFSNLNSVGAEATGTHPGTPNNCISTPPIQGGTGGGASNYTGSYSSTASLAPSTAVPEPASFLLVGTGLLGIARIVRRKRGA